MDGWLGVRPVRFREEIYALIQLVANNEVAVTIEEMRVCTLKIRQKREDRRLRALQKSLTLENTKRKRKILLTKVEQMIRILRATDLILKQGDTYLSTKKAQEFCTLLKQDQIGADAYFLELLLNSRYRTYWVFLKELFNQEAIQIPSYITKRGTEFRDFINSKGFLVDAWSFFIMRDLFYDFSLLNYTINENGETIFPLYNIKETPIKSEKFKQMLKGPDGYLEFWFDGSQNFIKNLVNVYLVETGNKWNRMVDLIRIREKYSIEYRIPEREFDWLLLDATKQKSPYAIVLSVGRTEVFLRTTYITKALSLPYNESGLPLSLIRIGLEGC